MNVKQIDFGGEQALSAPSATLAAVGELWPNVKREGKQDPDVSGRMYIDPGVLLAFCRPETLKMVAADCATANLPQHVLRGRQVVPSPSGLGFISYWSAGYADEVTGRDGTKIVVIRTSSLYDEERPERFFALPKAKATADGEAAAA